MFVEKCGFGVPLNDTATSGSSMGSFWYHVRHVLTLCQLNNVELVCFSGEGDFSGEETYFGVSTSGYFGVVVVDSISSKVADFPIVFDLKKSAMRQS